MAWDFAREAAEGLTQDTDHLRRVFAVIGRMRAAEGAHPIDAAIRAAMAPQVVAAPIAAETPVSALGAPSAAPVPPMSGDASAVSSDADIPTLGEVVGQFLNSYNQTAPMFKKHRAALNLLVELIGDVPVPQIRQRHIDAYFDTLCRLPPRWSDDVQRTGIKVKELAEQEHEMTLSPKTFEYSYMASIRPFLAEAKRLFGDAGFPLNLTV